MEETSFPFGTTCPRFPRRFPTPSGNAHRKVIGDICRGFSTTIFHYPRLRGRAAGYAVGTVRPRVRTYRCVVSRNIDYRIDSRLHAEETVVATRLLASYKAASGARRMCSSYANWRQSKSWYYEVSVVSPLTAALVDSTRVDSILDVLGFVSRLPLLPPRVPLFPSLFYLTPLLPPQLSPPAPPPRSLSISPRAHVRAGTFILRIGQSELPRLT